MKLFYQLFGYILLGIIIIHSVEEYIGFKGEIDKFKTDMIYDAIEDGKSLSGIIEHVWHHYGEEETFHVIGDANISDKIEIKLVWLDDIAEEFTSSPKAQEQYETLKAGTIITTEEEDETGKRQLCTYIPLELNHTKQGALGLSQPLVQLQQYAAERFRYSLIISIVLAVVCGVILYLFMDRKIRIPLKKLMHQAHRIGQGDLSPSGAVRGNGELAKLATTMDEMCVSLRLTQDKVQSENEARVKALEQLRHSDRLSSVGQLSADIAHEIGTPLNVIQGRAKMILHDDLSHEEIFSSTEIIKDQTEKISKTIRQLLDYTRRPERQYSRHNIATLIKQVFLLLEPIANKNAISFHLTVQDATDVSIMADLSQIQQVLVNHLINSIQAMPNGGKAVVTLSNETQSPVSAKSGRKQNFLKITVADEGSGIDDKTLKHIFTPFYTTKNIGEGTGLGLSISHGIVQDHKGWIEVESTRNKGARFNIFLPLEQQHR